MKGSGFMRIHRVASSARSADGVIPEPHDRQGTATGGTRLQTQMQRGCLSLAESLPSGGTSSGLYGAGIGSSTSMRPPSLDPKQTDDFDAVAEAVRKNGLTLANVSEDFRADPEIVRIAVAQNAKAFKYAAPALRTDPALVEDLTFEDMRVLDYSRLNREQKAEVAARVLTRPGGAQLLEADHDVTSIYVRLMGVDSFARDVIRKNRLLARSMVAYLGSRAPDFFAPLVEHDPLLLDCVGGACARALMERQPSLTRAYTELNEQLQACGINHPERIPDIDVLREVLANRLAPDESDPRPVAVVVMSARDDIGALEQNNIDALRHGYRLMYYEVDTDSCFCDAVIDATRSKRASVLVIGGHGTSDHVSFGAGDPEQSVDTDERAYLDLSDRKQLQEARLVDLLEEGSKVVLASCSTGAGRDSEKNVVNLLADLLPGSTVYGPVDKTNVVLILKPDGLLSHPRFLWNVDCYAVGEER